jgi:hypothetical protein
MRDLFGFFAVSQFNREESLMDSTFDSFSVKIDDSAVSFLILPENIGTN